MILLFFLLLVSTFASRLFARPRHLAFSPTAPFAYCINEIDNTVTSLQYDAASGTLSLLAGVAPVNLLPDGTAHRNGGGAAELTISNDGRFAYASVRTTGERNCIAPPTDRTPVLDLQTGPSADVRQ